MKGIGPADFAAFSADHYNGKGSGKPKLSVAQNRISQSKKENGWRYELKWKNMGALADLELSTAFSKEVNWIIIGEDGALLNELSALMKKHHHSVFWFGPKTKGGAKPDVVLSDNPDKKELFNKIDKLINLKAKQNITEHRFLFLCPDQPDSTGMMTLDALNELTKKTVGVFTSLLQALQETFAPLQAWVITQDAQTLDHRHSENLNIALAPVWGFAKTAYLEHPGWRGGLIDVSAEDSLSERANAIVKKVIKTKNERCVIIRKGDQYIEQIASANPLPRVKKTIGMAVGRGLYNYRWHGWIGH